jgi:hypothetical protein
MKHEPFDYPIGYLRQQTQSSTRPFSLNPAVVLSLVEKTNSKDQKERRSAGWILAALAPQYAPSREKTMFPMMDSYLTCRHFAGEFGSGDQEREDDVMAGYEDSCAQAREHLKEAYAALPDEPLVAATVLRMLGMMGGGENTLATFGITESTASFCKKSFDYFERGYRADKEVDGGFAELCTELVENDVTMRAKVQNGINPLLKNLEPEQFTYCTPERYRGKAEKVYVLGRSADALMYISRLPMEAYKHEKVYSVRVADLETSKNIYEKNFTTNLLEAPTFSHFINNNAAELAALIKQFSIDAFNKTLHPLPYKYKGEEFNPGSYTYNTSSLETDSKGIKWPKRDYVIYGNGAARKLIMPETEENRFFFQSSEGYYSGASDGRFVYVGSGSKQWEACSPHFIELDVTSGFSR